MVVDAMKSNQGLLEAAKNQAKIELEDEGKQTTIEAVDARAIQNLSAGKQAGYKNEED
jgi:hypothetical protein